MPPGFTLSPAEQNVTFQELATFTGGIPRRTPPQTQPAFQAFIAKVSPQTPLPASNVYSDCGIGLLGQTLMYQAGYTWTTASQNAVDADAWYQEFLLTALSMTSTTAIPPATGIATAYEFSNNEYVQTSYEPWCPWGTAGRMYSTASDMVNFIMANVGVTTINGNLVPQSISEGMAVALTPPSPPIPVPNSPCLQALAWIVLEPSGDQQGNICGKAGGLPGVSSYVAVNPTLQYGIVILLNMNGLDGELHTAAFSIMQALQPLAITAGAKQPT